MFYVLCTMFYVLCTMFYVYYALIFEFVRCACPAARYNLLQFLPTPGPFLKLLSSTFPKTKVLSVYFCLQYFI